MVVQIIPSQGAVLNCRSLQNFNHSPSSCSNASVESVLYPVWVMVGHSNDCIMHALLPMFISPVYLHMVRSDLFGGCSHLMLSILTSYRWIRIIFSHCTCI